MLHGNNVYLNVAEEVKRGNVKRYIYSVTDKIKAIWPTSIGYTPAEVTFK